MNPIVRQSPLSPIAVVSLSTIITYGRTNVKCFVCSYTEELVKRKTRGLACGIVKSLTKETMTTELKLCKDCKNFKTKLGKIEVCTAVVKGVDYEYGNNVYFYAYTQRYPYGSCKPQALLF